jgi:hypothetical protein
MDMSPETSFEKTLKRILLLIEQQIAAVNNGDLVGAQKLAELRDAEQCALLSRAGASASACSRRLVQDIFDAEARLHGVLEAGHRRTADELTRLRQKSRSKTAYNRRPGPSPRYLDYSL